MRKTCLGFRCDNYRLRLLPCGGSGLLIGQERADGFQILNPEASRLSGAKVKRKEYGLAMSCSYRFRV